MVARLTHVCLFTDNVQKLVDFYGAVLDVEVPKNITVYFQFEIEDAAVLSIYDVEGQNRLAPGVAA